MNLNKHVISTVTKQVNVAHLIVLFVSRMTSFFSSSSAASWWQGTASSDDTLSFLCLSPPSISSHFSSASLFREGHHSDILLPLERDLHELLLDLMCRFAPEQLLSFLQTSQHYRLEEAIQVLHIILHDDYVNCTKLRDRAFLGPWAPAAS